MYEYASFQIHHDPRTNWSLNVIVPMNGSSTASQCVFYKFMLTANCLAVTAIFHGFIIEPHTHTHMTHTHTYYVIPLLNYSVGT